MPAVLADLSIATRWIVPMRSRDEVLENHTLVVRDGRILDILPTREAANRYVAAIRLDRPDHLVLPGLVNAGVQIAPAVQGPGRGGALLCIAELLRAGTTCFCSVAHAPADSARIAAEQGLRAVIGLPIGSGEHFTDGLQLRDEYREHPSITTAFAPHGPGISDATFARIATLANELDAGIVMSLHESPREIAASVAAYGLRPMERMHSLGLLTPALTALHMAHVTAADVELAQRSGIAVVLCPQSSMRGGFGTPPVASWMTCDQRLGVGSGADVATTSVDLWSDLRLLALLSGQPSSATASNAWDALTAATRGGAAALGLDAHIGSLEIGKWADLCCLDLHTPALQRALGRASEPGAAASFSHALINALVFNGGRDTVSDVWVAGRHLMNDRALTRLDWSELAGQRGAPPTRLTEG
jgi:5-methylthioadenosine/S-adenosylhomocysteine deaminase